MKKNTKKKKVIIILSLLVILILSGVLIVYKVYYQKINTNREILGEERIAVQNEIQSVIKEYIKEIPEEYLNNRINKKITIEDLKTDLNFDISKFEKLKYGCIPEYTMIDFFENNKDYVISMTCEALYIKAK